MSDPAYFLPIVYDSTVGEACLKFGQIYRRSWGMYISMKDKGRIRQVLANWPEQDVRVICVSSGGRILGLGDLGANGISLSASCSCTLLARACLQKGSFQSCSTLERITANCSATRSISGCVKRDPHWKKSTRL